MSFRPARRFVKVAVRPARRPTASRARANIRLARATAFIQRRATEVVYPGFSAQANRQANSMNRQVRALIASKKRDAADVDRTVAGQTTTIIQCLSSSTLSATAASGTGLLDMDGDECHINSVRMKGVLSHPATLDLDPLGNADVLYRKLIVWYKKPLLVASAAGTLPPITEVLVSDTIQSLPVTDAANGGRFVILSDRKWNMGSNTYQAATALGHARSTGKTSQAYDYFVKVDKRVKFAANAQSGSNAGGHYDSDVAAGRVDAGLLVCYTQCTVSGPQTVTDSGFTRLNYTG